MSKPNNEIIKTSIIKYKPMTKRQWKLLNNRLKPNNEEWIKEFNKKYVSASTKGWDDTPFITTGANEIKAFISNLIAETKQQAIKDYLGTYEGQVYLDIKKERQQVAKDILEELPKEVSCLDKRPEDIKWYGYNQALKEVKDKISKYIK